MLTAMLLLAGAQIPPAFALAPSSSLDAMSGHLALRQFARIFIAAMSQRKGQSDEEFRATLCGALARARMKDAGLLGDLSLAQVKGRSVTVLLREGDSMRLYKYSLAIGNPSQGTFPGANFVAALRREPDTELEPLRSALIPILLKDMHAQDMGIRAEAVCTVRALRALPLAGTPERVGDPRAPYAAIIPRTRVRHLDREESLEAIRKQMRWYRPFHNRSLKRQMVELGDDRTATEVLQSTRWTTDMIPAMVRWGAVSGRQKEVCAWLWRLESSAGPLWDTANDVIERRDEIFRALLALDDEKAADRFLKSGQYNYQLSRFADHLLGYVRRAGRPREKELAAKLWNELLADSEHEELRQRTRFPAQKKPPALWMDREQLQILAVQQAL